MVTIDWAIGLILTDTKSQTIDVKEKTSKKKTKKQKPLTERRRFVKT